MTDILPKLSSQINVSEQYSGLRKKKRTSTKPRRIQSRKTTWENVA